MALSLPPRGAWIETMPTPRPFTKSSVAPHGERGLKHHRLLPPYHHRSSRSPRLWLVNTGRPSLVTIARLSLVNMRAAFDTRHGLFTDYADIERPIRASYTELSSVIQSLTMMLELAPSVEQD